MDDYGISHANTLEIPQSCTMYMELYTWVDKLMQEQCNLISNVLVTFLCFEASQGNNMGSLSIFLADFFHSVSTLYVFMYYLYSYKSPCPSPWSSRLDFIISFLLFLGLFDFFAAELIL